MAHTTRLGGREEEEEEGGKKEENEEANSDHPLPFKLKDVELNMWMCMDFVIR